MGYTTSGMSLVSISQGDGTLTIVIANTHTDRVIQCYLDGELIAWQPTVSDRAEFAIAGMTDISRLSFLAVDVGEGHIDYFAAAFGSTYGNRLRVRTPQIIDGYRPPDRWRAYRGNAGDGSATIKVHEQDFYPGGRYAGGFGNNFGRGGFGIDGWECRGFGAHFGMGEFGFDCGVLEWVSEPLPRGEYPVKVTVVDEAGNESTAATDTITIDTYARPAKGLAIDSYDQGTDTLVLTFTESEDL